MTAPLVCDIDHALLSVLGAELPFLAAGHAKVRPRGTPWVAAAFVFDVDHALLGVLEAEHFRLGADHAVSGPRGAPWVTTRCPRSSQALGDCSR